MSKYEPLSRRLRGHPADEWRASFSEIEDVLGFPLPKTARTSRSWWGNAEDKPHAKAWTGSGWAAGDVDPAAGLVTFRRGDIAPATVEAVLDPVGEIPAERLPKTRRPKPPAAELGDKAPAANPAAQANSMPDAASAADNLPAVVDGPTKASPIVIVAGVAAAMTVALGLGLLAFRRWSGRD